jgi:hypothetical protein
MKGVSLKLEHPRKKNVIDIAIVKKGSLMGLRLMYIMNKVRIWLKPRKLK